MIEQVLGQRQKLRQEQIMAPQQLQSLELLTATLTEMEQKITQEIESNPTLEMIDVGIEQPSGNPVEDYEAAEPADFVSRDDDDSQRDMEQRQLVDNLLRLEEKNRGLAGGESFRYGGDEESDQRHRYYWDSLVSEQSLEDLLQEQLSQTEELDRNTLRICREIIGSIDHTGYLRSHLADIATACQCTLKEAEDALAIVQKFEPPGIGARDLRECLLLQLERREKRKCLAWDVVNEYLDELSKNRLGEISKKMKIPMSELKQAIEEIRQLSPSPGNQVASTSPTEFVVPEVFVELDENGEPQIRTNREYTPRLRISPYYLRLLKDPEVSEEARKYIRDNLTSSKQLLKMIEQREATIVRIARSLVKFQYAFFVKGINQLQPLTMTQVAEDIGVHETTVSRAVAGKYMMTPQGLFAFRFFFTSGFRTENGETVSNQLLKNHIRDIVSAENRRHPLSDQQLVDEMAKKGFKLARRTAAKYREELGIPPSSLRRSF